jgi:very-short-patch-repair endonuclease
MLGERQLRGIVETAAVQGCLDTRQAEHIMAASRRRGAPLLRRILRSWHYIDPTDERAALPDLRSELEARLLSLITAAGLPAPRCNRLVEVGGSRLTVDFLWPERRVVVETDGARFHDNPVAFERDRLRDRELQLCGYRVVHYTYRQVEDEPADVVAGIRTLLGDGTG